LKICTYVVDDGLGFEACSLDLVNDQVNMATNDEGMDELYCLGLL